MRTASSGRRCAAVGALLAGCFTPCFAADAELEELAAKWQAQRGEIHSAHIKCKYLINAEPHLKAVSPEKLRAMLIDAGLDRGPLDLNRLARNLFATPAPGDPYAEEEFWMDGEQTRVVDTWDGEGWTDAVRRPDGDAFFSTPLRQVELYRSRGGAQAVREITDFRFFPELNPDRAEVVKSADGRLTVRELNQTIVVDAAQGHPLDCTWTNPAGVPTQERLERQFVEVSGITIPMTSVTADFQNGQLTFLWILVIDEVQLNAAVDPKVFLASVPPGFSLVDRRTSEWAVYRTSEFLSDALALPRIAPSSVANWALRCWRQASD